MKHIISASQFSSKDLWDILQQSEEMEKIIEKGGTNIANKKILATLFYEPSTRTRLSFETAMIRLGGNIVSTSDVNFSSVTKGEVLEDTIKIISEYADIIALRTKKSGEAEIAKNVSRVPILNGGDGSGEHPTQSLLDLFTIYKKFREKLGKDELTISFVGDLKYGRTVHSLCTILQNFEGININFVAPKEIQISDKYIKKNSNILTDLTTEILQKSDIIYNTRIQKERFSDLEEYEKLREVFIFNKEKVSQMKDSAILLHPLPRLNEITKEVDDLPQAYYFPQSKNGVPVRMTLISQCLGLI